MDRAEVISLRAENEAWMWRCHLCTSRGGSGQLGTAAMDAIDHLNDHHAATLIGDGR